jgi:putative nucleotidyltransferase with HDIG domain
VLVVAELTEKLAKAHGAKVELAVAGALLHDIADAVMARKSVNHEEESLKLAEKLLRESGFNSKDAVFIGPKLSSRIVARS